MHHSVKILPVVVICAGMSLVQMMTLDFWQEVGNLQQEVANFPEDCYASNIKALQAFVETKPSLWYRLTRPLHSPAPPPIGPHEHAVVLRYICGDLRRGVLTNAQALQKIRDWQGTYRKMLGNWPGK